jgi:hypothetical protein
MSVHGAERPGRRPMIADGDAPGVETAGAAPDHEALVAVLQQRAAQRRLKVDALAAPSGDAAIPWAADRLDRLEDAVLIEPSLGVTPSWRPGIGRMVTAVKRLLVRANYENTALLAIQTTAFHARTAGYLADLGSEVARLRRDVDLLNERVAELEAQQAERHEARVS